MQDITMRPIHHNSSIFRKPALKGETLSRYLRNSIWLNSLVSSTGITNAAHCNCRKAARDAPMVDGKSGIKQGNLLRACDKELIQSLEYMVLGIGELANIRQPYIYDDDLTIEQQWENQKNRQTYRKLEV
ncbi:hypothetical protein TRVL_08250 [Trypanosoma vivax]|nr:hypothetical protein TRVL_08250 [Trypanosoma vivax]